MLSLLKQMSWGAARLHGNCRRRSCYLSSNEHISEEGLGGQGRSGATWPQRKWMMVCFFFTWFSRMPSFKIESSGNWSKKYLDSILKVSIGTGKKSWQKTQPGLPQTGQIIQMMAKMDSISTEDMKALNRFERKNSNGEAEPRKSISGPDCNQNCCSVLTSNSFFPRNYWEAIITFPYLFSPSEDSKHISQCLELCNKES